MSTPLVILGGGGHAKVLLDALIAGGQAPHGILDVDPSRHGQSLRGVPILGDETWLVSRAGTVRLVNGLGSIRTPAARRALFERLSAAGFVFAPVIHPSAIVSPTAQLGEGVQIMAGAVVQPDVEIGANAIVNTRAAVDHDCVIGAHVHLSPGVTLSGQVRIGESTHVGTGVTVVQGVTIGRHCLIAAGAVVVRDVPDGATIMGVPGRITGS